MPPKSTALAVREIELTEHGAIPSDAIRDAVRNGTKLHIDLDDDDIAAAMLERKLSATSVDQLTTSSELDKIEDVYGTAVKVYGIGFRNSDEQYASQPGSLGVYVVLNVATLGGETKTVATGATDVVVTCSKILELSKLDTWWIIAPSTKETRGGFKPINMSPASVTDSGEPF
jgi:hypothetical protein